MFKVPFPSERDVPMLNLSASVTKMTQSIFAQNVTDFMLKTTKNLSMNGKIKFKFLLLSQFCKLMEYLAPSRSFAYTNGLRK